MLKKLKDDETSAKDLPGMKPLSQVGERWAGFSLARQFIIAASIVVVIAMGAIGAWVNQKIEQGVTQNTAAAAALYMDALIAPLAQDLAVGETISEENAAKLDALLKSEEIKGSVAAVKIWYRQGRIAYSTWDGLVGQQFNPTPALRAAWKGTVTAEFEGLRHEDDYRERALNTRLLEVYAPIRERSSDRIIAVSEFYIRADSLQSELNNATLQSWLVVGTAALLMMLSLSGIVSRGSRTIVRQKNSLEAQVDQLEELLATNRELRRRVQLAYSRSGMLNERFLRRVGSDLHDGPAQLLGLALLRLDELIPLDGDRDNGEYETVRMALADALKEIRNLSAGLVLPELDTLDLGEVVELVSRTHQKRTGTKVDVARPETAPQVPMSLKICAYRFIQEALNNAYRHAGGKGQAVTLSLRGPFVELSVEDGGEGIIEPAALAGEDQEHLGLTGLRDRIETLGGEMRINSKAEGGAMLTARFDLNRLNKTEG